MTPNENAVLVPEATLTQAVASISDQAKEMATCMAETGIEASDLEIPKLMLMQPTSGYVSDEKAKVGDIVNTMSMEVLGGFSQAIEIVPLKAFKTIRIYEMGGTQPKFMRVEPFVADGNGLLPWEDTEAGKPIKRVHNLNFFVLLKSELDSGEAFPAVIAFKSTSMLAGKQLATHIFKMVALQQEPYSKTVTLSVRKEKKETNTWAVFEVGKGAALSAEHKALAQNWIVRLASMNYKIHEADRDDEATPAATAPRPNFEPKEPQEDIY